MSLDTITLIVRAFLIVGALTGYLMAGYVTIKLIKFFK